MLNRIFFLSFLILGVFIFGNEVLAENEIEYNMEGEAADFDFENNSAKVRITMDSAFLHTALTKSDRFTISLESDEKLDISSFKYGDAIGGTSDIMKTRVLDTSIVLNIPLIKTISDLENTKFFTDVQYLSITTDQLLINPLQDVTASIYSDTASVSSPDNIAFPNATKFSIEIPKGSTDYYMVFSDDAEVIIDGIQHTPVDGWKNKAVILTLDSIGLKSLSITRNFFIESQWKDLKINWNEKFDFIIEDIKGELSIDEPKELTIPLARADDLILQVVKGDVIIKNLENSFQISSRGVANSIEHNEIDILHEEWWDFLNDPESSTKIATIVGILAIIGMIIGLIKWGYPRFRDWRLDYKNKKFEESGQKKKLEDDMADYLDGKFDI